MPPVGQQPGQALPEQHGILGDDHPHPVLHDVRPPTARRRPSAAPYGSAPTRATGTSISGPGVCGGGKGVGEGGKGFPADPFGWCHMSVHGRVTDTWTDA
ncbi:hypothetical protein GCM10010423_21050 [Streptomyces levis]|uniref:Uncharacterized protein n=1 Tax=Streptomyces levis TaxID=285566 RepID=A0ABN3NLW9_9ACTN